ncbi:prepilin-type N-terminal cleavage/methylation domain-containing protein [Candidatus Parcubacteria bacterium]|nr:prepilin-type N-terminal cleavage/methylation domain-containing protein [Candidatus Parcubacteria bacterium]
MFYLFKDKKGFTLIEMLVTLGIMVMMLSVVILGQRNYTEVAALTNLADEIGLNLSQAQAYGIAVKERTTGSNDFSSGYGLDFTLTESNKIYVSFIDRNASRYYDGDQSCPTGASSECLEKISILRGNYIDSFCIIKNVGADECGTVGKAEITFARPDPTARFYFFNTSAVPYNPAGTKGLKINLKSPSGLTKSVTVYSTGQISIQ